jgi:hypothetical protein
MEGVPRPDAPTLRQMQVPVALVIGGSPELVRSVEEAALSAQLLVAQCGVADATNSAAQMRPLVMIITEDVYSFDPESFEALARDVRSQVLTVPAEGILPEDLEAKLEAMMIEAENLRPSWSDELG